MLWRVSALHRRTESGRARPPRVELTDSDGRTVEAYLKSPAFHSAKSRYCLEREWIATQLAHDLQLPCAKILPVKVTTELIKMASESHRAVATLSEEQAPLDKLLQSGPEVLVGSVSLGTGWSEWTKAARVSNAQLEIASEIYFFDTMVQNWDRTIPNPNLLIKNGMYGMIDNEESFVEAAGSDAERDYTPKPWKEGGVDNDTGELEEHPLWQGIKSAPNATFEAVLKRCKKLPADRVRGYAEASVFDFWSRDIGRRISAYVLEAIDQVDAIHSQIEANRKK